MAKRVRGGRRLRAWTREVRRKARSSKARVEVGFFPDQKYRDGTPVAHVALVNEFGLGNRAERPFFRSSLAAAGDEMVRALRGRTDAKTLDPLPGLRAAGRVLEDEVRSTIAHYRDPDGTPALVKTGRLRDSVTTRVVED